MGHYDVLGVRQDASRAELRRAYLALARRHHPDRVGGSLDQMQALNQAWATLGDPDLRRRYDRSLVGPTASATPTTSPFSGEPPPRDERADLFDDLLDDRPIHGGMVRLPGWVALLPPGLFAAAILTGLFGAVLRLPAMVAFGVILGVLSALLFLASPFIALYASRRRTG
jgi:hypothetical protein